MRKRSGKLAERIEITLVGGPGDGQQHWVPDNADQLKWKPTEPEEQIAARMMGRPPNGDPIVYRRSVRTRTIFVYQP